MSHHKKWLSPRIQLLQEEFARGGDSAVEAFWQELHMRGTPLFEPVEDAPNEVLVTFVWQGDTNTSNVVLFSSLSTYMDGFSFEKQQMLHLDGTNVWYKTYRVPKSMYASYQFSPNDPLRDPQEVADWVERFKNLRPDPLNPHQMIFPQDEEILDSYSGVCSVIQHKDTELPYLPFERGNIQTGKVACYRFRSQLLHNERRIWIYTPPGYDSARAQAYGLLLLLDGFSYIHTISPPSLLDALLAAQHTPPVVTIYVDTLGETTRSKELPCYSPFVDFLTTELIPWMRERFHVTHDPQRTIISGSSYGGLAATFAGLRASNIFGNVLAQSGSFCWKPDDEEEDGWIIRQFEQVPRLPLRFSLQAGLWEPMLPAVRQMHTTLRTKGYPVSYHEYHGGHDDFAWHALFPLAFQELVQDW